MNNQKTIFAMIAIVVAVGVLVGALAVQNIVLSQQASAQPTGTAVGPFHGCRQGSGAFHQNDKNCIHKD
jgi:hypothetical protein